MRVQNLAGFRLYTSEQIYNIHFKVKGSKHCKSRREAYLVQKLLVGALLWAAAPIGQEVAEAGGGLANQGSSLVFC